MIILWENAPDPAFVRLVGDDTVVIKNRNTTIGYATFDAAACELSYIFVSPAFRNHGFGKMLVDAAQRASGKLLKPAAPVSPLGKRFFASLYKP
jgi:ribosomal protein S18 acetylase RimI-like enzyme